MPCANDYYERASVRSGSRTAVAAGPPLPLRAACARNGTRAHADDDRHDGEESRLRRRSVVASAGSAATLHCARFGGEGVWTAASVLRRSAQLSFCAPATRGALACRSPPLPWRRLIPLDSG